MAPAPGGRRRKSGGNSYNPYGSVGMVVEDDGPTARHRNRRSTPRAAAEEDETTPVVNTTTSTSVAAGGQTTNDDRRPSQSRPQNHADYDIAHQDPNIDHPVDPLLEQPRDDYVPVPNHITVDKSSTHRSRRSKDRNSHGSSGSDGGSGSLSKSNKSATHFLLKLAGACESHSVYHPELSSANNDEKKKRKMLRPPPLAPTTLPTSSSSSPGAGRLRHHQTMSHHYHHHQPHRVPDQCSEDIKKCSQILPRLKEKMPPPVPPLPPAQRQHERENDKSFEGRKEEYETDPSKLQKKRRNNRQLLGDVVHFCQFVETTLFGYYCPHMAELFGWGRDIHAGTLNLPFFSSVVLLVM